MRVDNLPLVDISILWTRPGNQGRALYERCMQLGAQMILFPTLEIRPYPCVIESLPTEEGVCIWTSANAVAHTPQRVMDAVSKNIKCVPIGQATADALRLRGVDSFWVPSPGTTSELFLEQWAKHLVLKKRKKAWIFTGAGGRDLLAQGLTDFGVSLESFCVYERTLPVVLDAQEKTSLWLEKKPVCLVTSQQSFEHLLDLVPTALHDSIFNSLCLTVSKRLKDWLGSKGVRRIITAHSAYDDDMLEALLSCKDTGFY